MSAGQHVVTITFNDGTESTLIAASSGMATDRECMWVRTAKDPETITWYPLAGMRCWSVV